jgi:hypothetical protein
MNQSNIVHDGISSIEVKIDGVAQEFPLEHLFDHVVTVKEFRFEDNRVESISIEVRPTNHVYSRKIENSDDHQQLSESGHLLIKYEHHEDRPHISKLDKDGSKIVSSDKRVFCYDKYLSSKNTSLFVEFLQKSSSNFCVLANRGDDRKCLSGLFEFKHGDSTKHCYAVIFKLHRLTARNLSMVIETAFLVDEDDFRVKNLKGKDAKPFLIAVKNVFAKRPPFQGPARSKSKKIHKKKKQARKKK